MAAAPGTRVQSRAEPPLLTAPRAITEFVREHIRERVLASLARARSQGKRLGRPKIRLPLDGLERVAGLTAVGAAERLGVSRSTVKRWRRQLGTVSV